MECNVLQFLSVKRCSSVQLLHIRENRATCVIAYKNRLRYSRGRAPTIFLYDSGLRALIWDRFCASHSDLAIAEPGTRSTNFVDPSPANFGAGVGLDSTGDVKQLQLREI